MPGKRVQFDQETWNALDLLAKDGMRDFQELADEAFADLLRKHGRPVDLKMALRQSLSEIEKRPAIKKVDLPRGWPMRPVALYTRVSTDRQTTENQERELRTIAARAGWNVVKVYRDEGISGAKGRDERPAFDALCKDAARRQFDMVMAWSESTDWGARFRT